MSREEMADRMSLLIEDEGIELVLEGLAEAWRRRLPEGARPLSRSYVARKAQQLRAVLLGAALGAIGCGATPTRGLVEVRVDQAFTARERDGIAAGVRFWDEVGAHLRTWADMTEAEQAQVAAGGIPALGFIPSEIPLEASIGWYDVATNRIRFDRARTRPLGLAEMTTLAAHETGHAFGLGHLPDGAGVMEPDGYPRRGLARADVEAFEQRYGRAAAELDQP